MHIDTFSPKQSSVDDILDFLAGTKGRRAGGYPLLVKTLQLSVEGPSIWIGTSLSHLLLHWCPHPIGFFARVAAVGDRMYFVSRAATDAERSLPFDATISFDLQNVVQATIVILQALQLSWPSSANSKLLRRQEDGFKARIDCFAVFPRYLNHNEPMKAIHRFDDVYRCPHCETDFNCDHTSTGYTHDLCNQRLTM